MKASIMIGGKSDQHERHELDFYPTPDECTIALLDFLKIKKGTLIWEPACGDGAISRILKTRGYVTVSTDLRVDSGYGIGGVDFLKSERRAQYVVTNPPFNLAAKFIHKCNSLNIEMYALLLKSQYWHAENRKVLFRTTKPSYVLPLTWRPNFVPKRGSAPTMEMAWTVWIKGQEETKYCPLNKPHHKDQLTLL